MTSDFLAIPDLSREELDALFSLAERMKSRKYDKKPLAGKTLAMIFMRRLAERRVRVNTSTEGMSVCRSR